MSIIIQGDNRIATDLATNLAAEQENIVLIGTDTQKLEEFAEHHEVRVIEGRCSNPALLAGLNLHPDDTFITVTNNDELNLVSSEMAASHGIGHCLCRLRNEELTHWVEKEKERFGITHIFRPDTLVKEQLAHLIQHPGAFQHVELHQGLVQVLGVKVRQDSPLRGRKLADITKLLPPNLETRITAIYTPSGPVLPEGETVVNEGDDVFFIANRGDEEEVIRVVHGGEPRNKRIMIAGGGNIGLQLALALQKNYQVKLVEHTQKRCEYLANQLDDVIVLQGNAGNRELLTSEYISEVDVFCAVTNDDETNYLSALLAKKLGAHHVISLINEAAYVDLVEGRDIDIVMVPSQIALSGLLGLVRRNVFEARRLRRGAAEVLSVAVNGKAVGKQLSQLKLPEGAAVGALVRSDKMLIAHKDVSILQDDSLICFLPDINRLHELTSQIT